MSSSDEFDVFLAHHSVDKPLVRVISTKLKERGLNPWIDEEQIAPGESFQDAIQYAIPTAKTAAIIIGLHGLGRWQNWEVKAIFNKCVEEHKKVIPVLLPGVDEVPEGLIFLRELRWINFNSSEDEKALKLLVWGITGKKPEEELEDDALPEVNSKAFQPSSFEADTYSNQALVQHSLKNYQGGSEGSPQGTRINPIAPLQTMPDSQVLLNYLKSLLPAQFSEVLFSLDIDESLLSSNVGQSQRAMEVIRLLKQSPDGLVRLESVLKEILKLSSLNIPSSPSPSPSPSADRKPVALADLTPDRRKELRVALINAFPEAPSLGLMVEDELGESLNLITQGQPNYELAVRDLIKWAEAKGRVQKLLDGALRANPDNPKLKEFAGL